MILVYKSTKEEERSLNYIKQISIHFKHNKEGLIVKSNQMLTADLREVVRSEAYVLEDNYRMKLVYLTKNDLNRLRHPLRNYIFLVKKGKNTIDIKHQDPYFRIFVSHYYHKNRYKYFLKLARYVQKASKICSKYVVYLERLFEYSILNEVKDYVLQKEDIFMSDYVVKKPFDVQSNVLIYGLKLNFPDVTKSKLYKLLEPTENIFNTGTEIALFSSKDFEINEQLEVENFIKNTQFIQAGYFLYDKSNVIKRSFITELNKLLSIYGSISYFGEKNPINQHK